MMCNKIYCRSFESNQMLDFTIGLSKLLGIAINGTAITVVVGTFRNKVVY